MPATFVPALLLLSVCGAPPEGAPVAPCPTRGAAPHVLGGEYQVVAKFSDMR